MGKVEGGKRVGWKRECWMSIRGSRDEYFVVGGG